MIEANGQTQCVLSLSLSPAVAAEAATVLVVVVAAVVVNKLIKTDTDS